MPGRKLQVGDQAPDFTLSSYSQTGGKGEITLSKLKNKIVLLAFYPKDNTPLCSKQMCSLRDNLAELKKKEIIPLGISRDKISSHEKFVKKYNLSSLILLSDEEKKVSQIYGISKGFWGLFFRNSDYAIRTLFIIDKKGQIAQIIEGMPDNKKLLQDTFSICS